MTQFVSRIGCPLTLLYDNGTNFVGANKELKAFVAMLRANKTPDAVHHFSSSRSIKWKFSPSKSSHLGGLWEAGVK